MEQPTMDKRVYGKGFPAAGEPIPESNLLETTEYKAYAEMVLEMALRRLKPRQPDSAPTCIRKRHDLYTSEQTCIPTMSAYFARKGFRSSVLGKGNGIQERRNPW